MSSEIFLRPTLETRRAAVSRLNVVVGRGPAATTP